MSTQQTRLFTISLWEVEEVDNPGKTEWRGKLQSLPDGEAYYFREWGVLIKHLENMLARRHDRYTHQEVE